MILYQGKSPTQQQQNCGHAGKVLPRGIVTTINILIILLQNKKTKQKRREKKEVIRREILLLLGVTRINIKCTHSLIKRHTWDL